jgi:hypothetical protein
MWHNVLEWLRQNEWLPLWMEGIALVFILFLDWREYRRQGKERIEQHEESAAQLKIMQGQAEAARDNANMAREGAEAAKANAEAAKLNAEAGKAMLELIINKERARIRVQLKPLDLAPGIWPGHAVEFSVHLHGPTEARILDSGAEVVTSNSAEPPPTGYMSPISLGEVMISTNAVVQKSAYFEGFRLDDAETGRIQDRKRFVHFRGFIRYKDVFERERETVFQYLWNVTDLNVPGQPEKRFAFWSKVGTSSDNAET